MALLGQHVLGQAMMAVDAMDSAEREKFADEILALQTHLLGSIVVLQHVGASPAQMEDCLNILLVPWQAMKSSGHAGPLGTEAVQERCLQRPSGKIRFAEGLPPAQLAQAIQLAVEAHGELQLLAIVYGHLRDPDMLGARTDTGMDVLRTALNLVDRISAPAAKAKRRPSA